MHAQALVRASCCWARWARCAALLLLACGLSSCLVTGLTVTGYYNLSGGLDHDARVGSAWRGPQGELAIALKDLEGACRHRKAVLVMTAEELELAFAGPAPDAPALIAAPHLRLPRAVLERELTLARPPRGAPEWVPVASWEPRVLDAQGKQRYVAPEAAVDAPFQVHWAHGYHTGAPGETGFVLLLTRTTPTGVERVLLLPEAFTPPAWTYALVPVALAADVLLIVLLLS